MLNEKLQNEVTNLLQNYKDETQRYRDSLKSRAEKTYEFLEAENITLSDFITYCSMELAKDKDYWANFQDLSANNYILGIAESVYFYRQVISDWSVKSYEWDNDSIFNYSKVLDTILLCEDLY